MSEVLTIATASVGALVWYLIGLQCSVVAHRNLVIGCRLRELEKPTFDLFLIVVAVMGPFNVIGILITHYYWIPRTPPDFTEARARYRRRRR